MTSENERRQFVSSSLCEKLGTAKAHDVSQRMRQLARLLTELRTLPASRLPRCSLEEYLRSERFDDVVAAVEEPVLLRR